MPARARETVKSSRRAPSCIIKATSPAAKSSPINSEAIRASETRTSALMSNVVTSPIIASRTIGTPHKITEIQARSKINGRISKRLASSAIREMISKVMSFFIPPHSRIRSSVFIKYLFSLPYLCRYIIKNYTYRGIGCQERKKENNRSRTASQLIT